MSLSKYEFKSSYNRIDDDIAAEFYLPCMRSSISYDRISGFFGSTVYVIAWDALKEFISNGGRLRIICSPILSIEDQESLKKGEDAKNNSLIAERLDQELKEMLVNENLNLPSRLLACLIANKILSIKIGIVKNDVHPSVNSMLHDKIGIFYDDKDNAVGFRGSFNETFKGLSNDGNIESVDVFQSWDGGKESSRVYDAASLFNRIWDGKEKDSISIYEIPDAFEQSVFEIAKKDDLNKLLEEIQVRISRTEYWKPSQHGKTPLEHQVEALDNWEKKNRRGILKHATGSGKTFTAICGIKNSLLKGETTLVLVPSKELLYHWKKEIEENIPEMKIHFLLCGDGNNSWKNKGLLANWTRSNSNVNKVIIAMIDTAANEIFIKNITGGNHLLIVADEVHRLGSERRQNIFKIFAGARLGLSATPERFGDEEGTKKIFDYFNGLIKPEYTLENAINDGVLTRYFYHPETTFLTSDEQEEWEKISLNIAKLYARKLAEKIVDEKLSFQLDQLLIKRARILKNAENKILLAINILKNNFDKDQKWIIYCDNIKQLKTIRQLAENENIDAYEYYAEMSGDRATTLEYFEKHGGVLVSIKCLDEGVDIPSTTHALIIASSKNPREFIQRRGRVLRKSKGKNFAHIYDVVVLPNCNEYSGNSNNIVFGELSRAIQFGNWAENPGCITELKLIALDYDINYKDYLNGGMEIE
ncbi:DEAD/DEAH box helicase family protein [Candidatus Enterococcus murrayae]|uniref:DEAD/DEAH box helicase family protein n=1 Tax=Candidatus Enterococcus murrayae TaxID=2815321 RepID=A0ABS3HNP9_9ENTE|nr:DEAD/DEAH box helicase family protein [Enterococcus sp. MJM16]MBO0455082.1 DEAD/DEAH box helicase family protein [Enterococcus sp. MJM16]